MQIEETVALYLDGRRDYLAPLTLSYYEDFLRRFITPMIGRNLSDILPSEFIQSWKSIISKTIRPRSQKTYRAVVCRWLDWCVEKDYLCCHEFRKIICDRPDAAIRPKVTLIRFSALLSAAQTLDTEFERVRAKALLWTAWACMLRHGEVIALKVDNLRLDSDEPQVLIEYGKGGRSAWLPLDYSAAEALRDWLTIRGRQEHNSLWCSWASPNTPMGRAAWPRLLKKLGQIAGIDPRECKTHGTRRGSATAMLQSGIDIATVSKFLRHANIQTTWDYVEAGSLRMSEPGVRNWTSIALSSSPIVKSEESDPLKLSDAVAALLEIREWIAQHQIEDS